MDRHHPRSRVSASDFPISVARIDSLSMKNNLITVIVIVLCTAAICFTIKTSVPEKIEARTEWEYEVATGSLADGKWLKDFGGKGWELVETLGEGSFLNERAFIFKRPSPNKNPSAANKPGV